MKFQVYHAAAWAELEAEVSHCEAERRGAGPHVRADIAETLALVCEFPGIGRRDIEGAQRIVTRRYRLIIPCESRGDRIAVWAVAHPAREPGYW